MSLPPPPRDTAREELEPNSPYTFDSDPEDTINDGDMYLESPVSTDLDDPVFDREPYDDPYDNIGLTEDYNYPEDTYEPSQPIRRFEGEDYVEVEQAHRPQRKFVNDPTTWVDEFMFLAEGVYPFLLLIVGLGICLYAASLPNAHDLRSRLFDVGQTIALVGTGANVKQVTGKKR